MIEENYKTLSFLDLATFYQNLIHIRALYPDIYDKYIRPKVNTPSYKTVILKASNVIEKSSPFFELNQFKSMVNFHT